MLDPITALGLAGNVVQIISFAHELVSEGNRIYHAVDGVLIENKDAGEVASDLAKLTKRLTASQNKWLEARGLTELDEDETRLRNICERCSEIAVELNNYLLKVKVEGKHKRIKSFKQALVSVWRKDAIEDICSRLEKYQREVDTRILFGLRKSLQETDVRSSQQFQVLDQQTKDLTLTVLEGNASLDGKLDSQTAVLSQLVAEQGKTNKMLLTIVGDSKALKPRQYVSAPAYEAVVGNDKTTALHEASETGDSLKVRQLLRSPTIDINARDMHGCTPLHVASTAEVANRLLSDKAIDKNAEDYEGRSALHCAVLRRRLEVIKTLLQAGIDVLLEDDQGKTATFYAEDCPAARWMLRYGAATEARALDHLDNTGLLHMAWLGDLEGTHYFLSQGADVNVRNKWEETALTEASRHGDAEIVSLLLSHNANMELPAGGEWTPLLQAVRDGREDVVSILLRHGAKTDARLRSGNDALAEACARSHFDIAKMLIDAGCDVNSKDASKRTPLLKAAYQGASHFIPFLLERGADTEARDQEGRTAVYQAAKNGHQKTLQALLDHGANVYATTLKDTYTPLIIAAQNGELECVKLLLDHGANPDALSRFNSTALAETTHDGHVQIAELLIKRGADVEMPTRTGFTAISVAAHRGQNEIIRLLADAGANLDSKGFSHKNAEWSMTPLMRAAKFGHAESVALLADLGANIDARDLYDRTALHFAANEANLACVDVLIEKGASVNVQSNDGTTPLIMAAFKGSEPVVRRLVEANANLRLRTWKGTTAWIQAKHSKNDKKLAHLLAASEHEDETLRRLQAERHPHEIAGYLNEIYP